MANLLNKLESLIWLIPILIGINVGFFLYHFFVNLGFHFAKEATIQFDPFSIISLVITLIFALFITRKLQKLDEGQRAEKELLVGYFTSFDIDFTAAVARVAKNGSHFDYVVPLMRRYRMRLQSSLHLVEQNNYLPKDSELSKALLEKMKCIVDFLTDTPQAGAVENGVRLQDGKLYFSDNQLDKITTGLLDLKAATFSVLVAINRQSPS